MRVGRRAFLAGSAALAAPLGWAPAAEASVTRELAWVERGALGTTLAFRLPDAAPFPSPRAAYQDPTVLVFVPGHYAPSRDGRTGAVVHFHGHKTTADRAMAQHRLREQLVDSKQDAILIVPQGPVLAADSGIGKLEEPGGFARFLVGVSRALGQRDAAQALGRIVGAAFGTLCVSAHSGGYHAAAQCVRHGGAEVIEVYLFDALYAEAEAFAAWVEAGRGRPIHARHKLVTYYTGGATEQNSVWLAKTLADKGVRVAREDVEGSLSRDEITRAEVVAIKAGESHEGVTSELNQLRDCLYASALPRRLKTSWFDARTGARPMERRR